MLSEGPAPTEADLRRSAEQRHSPPENAGRAEPERLRRVGSRRSRWQSLRRLLRTHSRGIHQPGYREIRHLLLADLIADIPQALSGHLWHVAHPRRLGDRARHHRQQEAGVEWNFMRQLGLKGLPGPKTRSWNPANEATEEDLVERRFLASAPNELWLTDVTEHPTLRARSIAASSSTSSHARRWAGPSTGAASRCSSTTRSRWRRVLG